MPLLFSLAALMALMAAPDSATVVFAGDAMQHQRQLDAAKGPGGYDFAPCFEGVRPWIQGADYAVVNLETPLGGAPYSGYPCFCAPDSYLDALAGAGFDLFLAANNHVLDRRDAGLARTIGQLERRGLSYAGIYRSARARDSIMPRVVDVKGFKIAFLNYTYGTNGFAKKTPVEIDYIDRELMGRDIRAARAAGAELIAACVHWGDEYQLEPNARQRELARWLHAQGVEMVVGSHPHVVQPMELAEADSAAGPLRALFPAPRQLTVYSLGNFISAMRTPDTRGGAVARVTLRRDALGRAYVAQARYGLVFVDPRGYRLYTPEDTRITPQSRTKARDWARRARAVMARNKGVPEM